MTTQQRVQNFASWLDTRFEIPGLGIRFGWDALIGLIPGFGDMAGVILASYILIEAIREGAPNTVLARMFANMIVDGAMGSLPLVGDVADVAFKANQRNANLLIQWLELPEETVRRSRLQVALSVLALIAVVAALLSLAFLVTCYLWKALFQF